MQHPGIVAFVFISRKGDGNEKEAKHPAVLAAHARHQRAPGHLVDTCVVQSDGHYPPTFYALRVRPVQVRLGKRLVRLVESPAEYNLRVLKLQQAAEQLRGQHKEAA